MQPGREEYGSGIRNYERKKIQPEVEGQNFNKLQAPSLTVTEG